MTLSEVFRKSLRSIAEFIIGFIVFLAALLAVLDYLGFNFSLAVFYNNLDSNGKITFIFAITILVCSSFFAIIIYALNRLVREIDDKIPQIIKSKR